MGPGLSPAPCIGLPTLLASQRSFPVSNALWGTPPITWLSGLPWEGLSRTLPLFPFHTTPHLPSFPTLIFSVTIYSMTMCPQLVGSEGAGPKSGLITSPKALRQCSMAVQWDPGISHRGLGPWFICKLGGAGTLGPTPSCSHTREKAHSRQYPPGHQLLSIVTAGGGGMAQESRGKSGVVKGKTGEIVRRNCG